MVNLVKANINVKGNRKVKVDIRKNIPTVSKEYLTKKNYAK